MGHDRSLRFGFRPTFRHLLILVVYCAVLLKLIIPFIMSTGHATAASIVLRALAASPPLLVFIVALVEHPGALKNWCLSLLLVLFFPALVLNHDFAVLYDYLQSGKLPTLWATALINGVVFGYSLPFVVKMFPRRCPSCRRRSLVPLLRIFMKDPRSANTRWCATCGGQYWRDREGLWRKERRKTWLDTAGERPPVANPAPPVGRPEDSGTPHRPLGGRAASGVQSS
jgi:hypothetical protein